MEDSVRLRPTDPSKDKVDLVQVVHGLAQKQFVYQVAKH